MAFQTGRERLSSDTFLPPWTWYEHRARYEFCAPFVKDKVVIDCACGAGVGSLAYARAGAAMIHAFDISDEALRVAGDRHAHPCVIYRKADARALPLPDSCADVYVCLETIEHIEDDHAVLKEAARVLKHHGVFICSTPNRRVTNPGTSLHDKPWISFHVREYDGNEFTELLRSCFDDVHVYGQNSSTPSRVRLMERLTRWFSPRFAVRVNQAMKLHRFVIRRAAPHRVCARDAGCEYEFMVAVCRSRK
jgi:ubiquinone/menaquinone biosynthesis C-methylase UbiE